MLRILFGRIRTAAVETNVMELLAVAAVTWGLGALSASFHTLAKRADELETLIAERETRLAELDAPPAPVDATANGAGPVEQLAAP